MIKKQREIPLAIKINEALLRRIASNHEKRSIIESDLLKRYAGFRGEQKIDYYLGLLQDKQVLIFHDIRLSYKNYFFQIDTLLVTPTFILIIEVKNISGTLYFDSTFNQLIRKINDKEEGFSDPITQAKRHQHLLSNWLTKRNIPTVPIEYLVVISNPSTIIKTNANHGVVTKRIIHAQNLFEKIIQLKNLYSKEILTKKYLNKLSKIITSQNTTFIPDILQTFNIPQVDIKIGVQCPNCFTIPIQYKFGKWYCTQCNFISKDAYKQAILDYFLLIDTKITNQILRSYLEVPSRMVATKLLISMGLTHTGNNKGRVYYSPFHTK